MSRFIKKYFFILIAVLFFSAFFVSASNINGTISPNSKWAFGDKLGWINFACTNCNVHVTDDKVAGYAWSKQYGWINLSPIGNIGVSNNCSGILGGYAWSKSLGWLNFSGAQINASGNFVGMTYGGEDKAGKINFSCDHCGVSTDWQQCALRESPAQVVINHINNSIIPNISANITITNEGNIDTEYQYEWCVVSDITNSCGGGDDIFYASGAKDIAPGISWTTDKIAVVPTTGNYYFKLVAHYGIAHYSVASMQFTATNNNGSGGGGGGGGGGGNTNTVDICPNIAGDQNVLPFGYVLNNGQCILATNQNPTDYQTADFNRDGKVDSIDFSILLYFWKKNPPFTNKYVDINKDGKVDSIDFSIMLSEWGKKKI